LIAENFYHERGSKLTVRTDYYAGVFICAPTEKMASATDAGDVETSGSSRKSGCRKG
jgi:hypothetical protein